MRLFLRSRNVRDFCVFLRSVCDFVLQRKRKCACAERDTRRRCLPFCRVASHRDDVSVQDLCRSFVFQIASQKIQIASQKHSDHMQILRICLIWHHENDVCEENADVRIL